ncbi:MAG: FAD-dependent oxidoreductase [Alkalibacterium sp.]|nr:FAD-dependent oxidoreductase [Alkalibacterium sp.]
MRDFKGLFKKSTATIDWIENPIDDLHVIHMSFPDKLTWEAGEHGVFTLPDNKVSGKPFRAFSVASIPEEGKMIIATDANKPTSSFKSTLFNLSRGDTVTVRGPFGWFKVQDKTSPIVMISTGIGITPMRALVKQLEKDQSRPIYLVYASPSGYLFKDLFDDVALHNPSFKPVYTSNKEDTIKAYTHMAQLFENSAYYYISGKSETIKATKKELKQTGIKRKRMITDPYFGY